MAKESDATLIVMKFVYDQVPATLLQAYNLLASLDYPIPDRQSLEQALEQYEQGENEATVAMVLDRLRPVDFGLDSPRGALEKFTARLETELPRLLPEWPFPVPEEPDPIGPLPSFGDDACGRAAERFLQESLDRFGHVPGFNSEARRLADRLEQKCRELIPAFEGRCAEATAQAWANCYVEGGSSRGCNLEAWIAHVRCEAAYLGFPRDPFPWPGRRFPVEP